LALPSIYYCLAVVQNISFLIAYDCDGKLRLKVSCDVFDYLMYFILYIEVLSHECVTVTDGDYRGYFHIYRHVIKNYNISNGKLGLR
jgi:hypothetical protein